MVVVARRSSRQVLWNVASAVTGVLPFPTVTALVLELESNKPDAIRLDTCGHEYIMR